MNRRIVDLTLIPQASLANAATLVFDRTLRQRFQSRDFSNWGFYPGQVFRIMNPAERSNQSAEYEAVVDGLGITHWLPKSRRRNRKD